MKDYNGWTEQFRLLDTVKTAITQSVPYEVIALMMFLWFSGKKDEMIKKRSTVLYAFFRL
ncbi:hypothetical protein BLL40_09105 [Domibacillus mangrovi]|uniref:Uncharacterized protein n=1 Tax=Domibacillus mangrovi TaxID=1714354 RepID=A0A1Q5P3Q8_9BACI|nr:hypothetical protein BLL40_09105 [Domibacillus mangrovi]